MQNITDIATTTIVFGAFAIVVLSILNFIIKMRIINAGYKDESWVKSLTSTTEYKYTSLKWALLLFFGGLGLIIVSVINITDAAEQPLTYGILSMSLSAGFSLYYIIVTKSKSVN